tara:strand:+ start:738 stop:1145 length:408 start_codon:yes stop_codon:yes gene_type:complete
MEIKLKINSDLIGASASTLCTIHCFATPLIFFASTCTETCCASAPTWWIWLDYAFLIISFFAVYRSTKSTSKLWIKPALWFSFLALFTFIFIEHNTQLYLSHYYKYSAALSLATSHIYNLKYCQCESDKCCSNNN